MRIIGSSSPQGPSFVPGEMDVSRALHGTWGHLATDAQGRQNGRILPTAWGASLKAASIERSLEAAWKRLILLASQVSVNVYDNKMHLLRMKKRRRNSLALDTGRRTNVPRPD